MNAWRNSVDKDLVERSYLPAALTALGQFPVEVQNVVPVSISENVTFRVSARDSDTDFVLRLHRPHYNSIEELDSERLWTRALRQDGIAVPDSLQTLQGENYTLVDIPGTGERRYAGVTTWIEGTTLQAYLEEHPDPVERERSFRWIGATLARLHNHSARWQEPPGFTRRRLDLDALLGESPAWGCFWEHSSLTEAERSLLLEKRQEFRGALARYGEKPDNFGLIHADVDPNNIIRNGDRLALIDFDDLGYGWHMYDMALTLDEFLYARDLATLQSALIDGYREHRSLAAEDVAMLPLFLIIRGMALIGWYHERPEHAGSTYFEEVKAWVLDALARHAAKPQPGWL